MTDCNYRGYRIVTKHGETWCAEIYAPGTYGVVETVSSRQPDERAVILMAQARIDQDCPRHC
ncbi:hypothetical protein [Rhodoplanes roseus]|uniref:Uncharacterized protein n=1 Tax=Rhodoplanes roseus TaxID=29409 RepID=A0A327L0Q6_9BRAD|nr:hypothetical protein [Rhodoplanes roseus]RAI43525.1 hypothetical protein CH341_13885 [Rhodoplanes roseus]